jgi:hypothetical protein
VGEQLSFVEREEAEEAELVRRELKKISVAMDGALVQIDLELTDPEHWLGGRERSAEHGA